MHETRPMQPRVPQPRTSPQPRRHRRHEVPRDRGVRAEEFQFQSAKLEP